jgi:hypothetical protein
MESYHKETRSSRCELSMQVVSFLAFKCESCPGTEPLKNEANQQAHFHFHFCALNLFVCVGVPAV